MLVLRPLERRWKEHIESMAKSVFDYLRNHLFEGRAVSFKARIGVNVDEPGLEIFIHDELALNQLEARAAFAFTDKLIVSLCKGREAVLHDGKGVFHKAVLVSIDRFKVILKMSEVNLIARLILSKLIVLDLNALCRKVAELVVKRANVEWFAGSADHSFTMQVNMRLLFLNESRSTRRTMSA